ncbi:MAG: hypothetical protein ACRD0K_24955 [Egibacteraceae bacterium]
MLKPPQRSESHLIQEDAFLHETEQGVYGLAAVVADFDDADLATLRRVAEAIRTTDRPGVQAAIALAGSAAQSKFQLYPGDCDFFERVHVQAETRAEAITTLVNTMIETIARAFPHPELQFSEMVLGLYPTDVRRGDDVKRARGPIRWSLTDVDARSFAAETASGEAIIIDLFEAAQDVGYVKLDWLFADSGKNRIIAVSKAIDATWEAPDGTIIALDSALDSFYQEVYLDPASREHVERLINQVAPAGLREYVAQLEGEIEKYTKPGHENYGKVAKRLYNIFRITGQPQQAAYLRGLFDDPPARLYQVSGAMWAVSKVMGGRRLSADVVKAQLDELEDILRDCYQGDDLDELVKLTRSLPDLEQKARADAMDRIVERATAAASDYFEACLAAEPVINELLISLRDE